MNLNLIVILPNLKIKLKSHLWTKDYILQKAFKRYIYFDQKKWLKKIYWLNLIKLVVCFLNLVFLLLLLERWALKNLQENIYINSQIIHRKKILFYLVQWMEQSKEMYKNLSTYNKVHIKSIFLRRCYYR